jgi:hypothetical protein
VNVEDSFTKMICSKCSILLTHFFAFKDTCTKSDIFLKSLPINEKDDFGTNVNLQKDACDPIQLSIFIPCDIDVNDSKSLLAKDDIIEDIKEKCSTDSENDDKFEILEAVSSKTEEPTETIQKSSAKKKLKKNIKKKVNNCI